MFQIGRSVTDEDAKVCICRLELLHCIHPQKGGARNLDRMNIQREPPGLDTPEAESAQRQTEMTLGEAALRWLGRGAMEMVFAAGSPALVLNMLVDAVHHGELEVLDRSHPEPTRWVATVEALRAFGATRHCMPEFLEDGR